MSYILFEVVVESQVIKVDKSQDTTVSCHTSHITAVISFNSN